MDIGVFQEVRRKKHLRQWRGVMEFSPEYQAQQDYREDCFMNPYREGSEEWKRYEQAKENILNRLIQEELGGF